MPDLLTGSVQSNQTSKDVLKGRHILNQLVLFEQVLDLRIQLQSAVKQANELPEPGWTNTVDKASTIQQQLDEFHSSASFLIESLDELQQYMISSNDTVRKSWRGEAQPESKFDKGSINSDSEIDSNSNNDSEIDSEIDSNSNNDSEIDSEIDSDSNNDSEIDSDSNNDSNNDSYNHSESNNIENSSNNQIINSNNNQKLDKNSDYWFNQLEKSWSGYTLFRDETILKWSEKVNAATMGNALSLKKLKILNKNALTNFKATLTDMPRLCKKSQLKRIEYKKLLTTECTKNSDDYDAEIYDDVDFYQVLLGDLLDHKLASTDDPITLSQKWAAFRQLQKQTQRKRTTNKDGQLIDRKASKGRKLRYHVHEKLEGFMASQPMPVPEALQSLQKATESLSTLRLSKPTSVGSKPIKDFEFRPEEFE